MKTGEWKMLCGDCRIEYGNGERRMKKMDYIMEKEM